MTTEWRKITPAPATKPSHTINIFVLIALAALIVITISATI